LFLQWLCGRPQWFPVGKIEKKTRSRSAKWRSSIGLSPLFSLTWLPAGFLGVGLDSTDLTNGSQSWWLKKGLALQAALGVYQIGAAI